MIKPDRSSQRTRPVRRLAVALVVTVLLAACSSSSPTRQFQTELGPSSDNPLPVVLSDETGLVTSIEAQPFDTHLDYGQPAIQADPTDPRAFFVTWGGGPSHDAALTFKPFQDGYLLRLELHSGSGFPGGGDGALHIGVVRIVTTRPIPLGTIQVGGSANT